jgi:hypothetical protein
MPISDDGPLYVIVHRRHDYGSPRDQVYDIQPDDSLEDITERAGYLQYNAQEKYGRTRDTYRVAELRMVAARPKATEGGEVR